MIIKNLYERKIDRHINPAVVVGEMDDYHIKQEIEEYIFTSDLIQNVHKFLSAVAHKKEGKTGIWVSGYYGSGKSHFIKYLFYCLSKEFGTKAVDNFIEAVKDQKDITADVSLGDVTRIRRSLEKLDLNEVIFNIDVVSGDKNDKEAITKILFNELNKFRGYNSSNVALALFIEKELDQKGLFNQFKTNIKEQIGEDWEGNQVRFTKGKLKKVLEIAHQLDVSIDTDSVRAAIKNEGSYSVEDFIKELTSFLEEKDDNYRLLFLIDEVSQYIGSNTSLLLNLQSIIEEIGEKCGHKIWMVCTAQQELNSLADGTDQSGVDFGKIFGRFETMISLQSQDATFITKKRVLDKSPEGLKALKDYYKENKGGIENQFSFTHDLYKNYENADDFYLTYPFVPYQFRLISDVFTSFSQIKYVGEGVKDTARSILGIIHFTAQLCAEEEIGYFVPFDLFFNEQFKKNLTHFARNMLDRAYNIDEVKNDDFAQRVVNVLFMVSNLTESLQQTFPANSDNLALLLMNSVHDSKVEMQTKVTKVLDILVTKKIIQESEGKYRFLKEDEIEVAHIIDKTNPTLDERLSDFYDDFLSKIITQKTYKYSFGTNNFKASVNIDDKAIINKGDFQILFSLYDKTPVEQMAHQSNKDELLMSLGSWFLSNKQLREDFLNYTKTKKYIADNKSTSSGTRAKTISAFSEENELLGRKIKKQIEANINSSPFISAQQIIHPEDLNGQNPSKRFEEAVDKHLEEVYKKQPLVKDYATSNTDLEKRLKDKQLSLDSQMSTPAEEELEAKLRILGQGFSVFELVRNFEKAPYGWKDISTIDVLLVLTKKGKYRLEYYNNDMTTKEFVNKVVNSRERQNILIYSEKQIAKADIDSFVKTINHDIFAENLIPTDLNDFKQVIQSFKDKLKDKLKTYNKRIDELDGYKFNIHYKNFHKALSELYQERNNNNLLEQVAAQKETLKKLRDYVMQLDEFVEENLEKYKSIKQFQRREYTNFQSLDETNKTRSERLKLYFAATEPWEEYPEMLSIYKKLGKAIKNRVEELRSEVIEVYKDCLEYLEKFEKEHELEKSVLPSWEELESEIAGVNGITELELKKRKEGDFRTRYLKIILNNRPQAKKAAGSSPKTATQGGSSKVEEPEVPVKKTISHAIKKGVVIQNEKELDQYISKLKAELLEKIKNNIIIIE